MPKNLLLITLCALVLSSCGGSSGGSNDTGTPAPTPPPTPSPTPTGGLDQRPENLSCIAPDLPGSNSTGISLEQVFPNLPAFNQPLAMLQAPGDDSRWFVLQKGGLISVFDNLSTVSSLNTSFIDLNTGFNLNDSGEGGLLGMAFDPNFASNGEVYISWTEGNPMVSVISRFTSNNGGLTIDPGSREDIIRVNQDFTNHNGGNIAFGTDDLLYIGLGDGGSAGDPNSRAQDTTNMLGAMLRIDTSPISGYDIPASNPFSTNPQCPADHSSLQNCPEIYAWGLRNPWRWSFDRATGDLWLADVGQGSVEEVDIIERNGNYGWDCREGENPYSGSQAASCSSATNLIDPVHEYSHSLGNSITGGYVYRGSQLNSFIGHYFFADFGSGRIWRLSPDGSGGWIDEELLDSSHSIASFGESNDGELYIVNIGNGRLYQIVPEAGSGSIAPTVPQQLSATGCVVPTNPSEPESGLIPFETAAPFWSDNAVKERWLALPDGSSITVSSDGDFIFPNGSVLMKHFRLNGDLIETRLLMSHTNGTWAGYSYEWNGALTDATLVTGGKVESIDGQDWIFPSSNNCLSCHTDAANFVLGPEASQLNNEFTYSVTGRSANQLATLDEIGLFSSPLSDPSTYPSLNNPSDTAASLNARARAYLHTNCAQCHRANGPTPSTIDLHFNTSLNQTNSCDMAPQSGDLGIGPDARIIAPGSPSNSVLLQRMQSRDSNAMPPLGSSLVDANGTTLISDWISSLSTCQ